MTNPTNLTNPTLTPCDEFCAQIYAQVSARIKVLYKGIEYRSEHLCGEDFWVMLGDGKQRLAGKCIRKLAEMELLPLVIVPKRHEYPLYFKIV